MADPRVKVVITVDDKETAKIEQSIKRAADAAARALSGAGTAAATAATKVNQYGVSTKEVARLTALGEKELARYEQTLARTATQQGEAATKTATFSEHINTLATTLRNVVMVAGVVGATLKKTFDLGKEGAQITQTNLAFQNFAQNIAGMPDLLDQLRQGAAGTITDFDLMRNTLTLVAGTTQEAGSGLARAAPQLLEIARAAQILNPALGDVNYFYQSLATGIKRLEPRWVDNLGLIVKARDAYSTYARQLGISTQALNAEQKSQAFLNEVLRVGNLLIEQTGSSVSSAVDPWSRLEVQVTETGNVIKQFLADGLLPYVQLLNGEYKASSAAIEQINSGTKLSIEELTQAYEESIGRLAVAKTQLAGPFFVDADQEIANIQQLEREIARAAGSYEEFARIMGQTGTNPYTGEQITASDEELRARYERLVTGIQGATKAQESQKVSLQNYLTVQDEHIELTEEEAEALAKLKEAWADVARNIIENTGNLNQFSKDMLAAADSANLTSGQLFRLVGAMGILSESELQAAKNAQEFRQIQAHLMAEFARTGNVQAFVQQITAAARRLGIDYLTAAQHAAQATQLLTSAANLGLGSMVRWAQGLGNAANQALRLKKSNDAATQSVQRLATVSAGAASAFIGALEGGMAGGGGGSAIDAATQAQEEWNQAFAQSFMQLLDAEKPIENWNLELLKAASAAGATADQLVLLAAATGEYSDEQIQAALRGAAMQQAVQEIAQAMVDGRATAEQAQAALAGFQEQLAAGGDFKFNIEDFGIEPLREQMEAAGGGAGGAADETKNWVDELLQLASQGKLTAGDLVALATATGKYDDATIRAALKTLFMTQKMEELAQQIGKRPIQDIISDLQQFETDLDKQFELQFDSADAEEGLGRVSRALDNIPEHKTVTVEVEYNQKNEPPPGLGDQAVGGQNAGGGATGGGGQQLGGPLSGETLVGEVRPEMVVGSGYVIPRLPPGYFSPNQAFTQVLAQALGSVFSPPAGPNHSTTINRSSTINNNQKSVAIHLPTPSSLTPVLRRELGAM